MLLYEYENICPIIQYMCICLYCAQVQGNKICPSQRVLIVIDNNKKQCSVKVKITCNTSSFSIS